MTLKIGVMGAGAVGCYVGALLASEGCDVRFVGRASGKREVEANGMTAIALDGTSRTIAKPDYVEDPSALSDRDVVLCCVKSAQSAEAGAALARSLPKGALVVSLQNGVRNAETLRGVMPEQRALGGIVGFNVVAQGHTFRCATSGPLVIERLDDGTIRALEVALRAAGFEVETLADIAPMQWSKLVMNLANAVGALSGAPTKELLMNAGYRRVVRAVMAEALMVMEASGVRTTRLGAIPVKWFPMLLSLPTPLLRVVSKAQVAIDPQARSSMWQDLDRKRNTEVDDLNGEIVALAAKHARIAPINERVVRVVHEVEARREGSPNMSPDALSAALGL